MKTTEETVQTVEEHNMAFILNQLSRTGLLPGNISTKIIDVEDPILSGVISHLLIGSLDADALTAGDKTSSWTQRRLSRQLLGLTFLTALVLEQRLGPIQLESNNHE